jgi:esterase FrsA
VDTWKMKLHGVAVLAARKLGARIATIDMPGTGESPVANSPDGEHYIAGVVEWLRQRFPGSRRIGTVGFSFGGYWTIKLALMGVVDAAVSVGGLVETVFTPAGVARLRFGMPGIFGNSLRRWDAEPSRDQIAEAMATFSLRTQGLLEDWGSDPVPLLFYNGMDDPHVPVDDAKALEPRPNTIVRLVPKATHCAMEQAQELVPWSFRWLGEQLG